MDKNQIIELLEAYEKGTLSENQIQSLKRALMEIDIMEEHTFHSIDLQESKDRVLKRLMETGVNPGVYADSSEGHIENQGRTSIYYIRIAIGAAASVLLLVGLISQFKYKKAIPVHIAKELSDVEPATFKARLTINNSAKSYKLTGSVKDSIAMVNGALVKAPSPNTIVYQSYENLSENQIPSINTISTPRGGTYNVTLGDGTEVMLNAASSITFPVPFEQDKREVTITGEVFFKVKHQLLEGNAMSKPFIVKAQVATGQVQNIKVLGTHFNVLARPNTPITTSLVEGKVLVTTKADAKTILPGQKSILVNGSLAIKKLMESDIAWTKNLFEFQDQTLETIMAEASRWYDVDIKFEDNINLSQKYTITLERDKGLKTFTSIIENLGFVCSLENSEGVKSQDNHRTLFIKRK
ncbi:hypothetical protein COR50_11380 [Chitinophaga caeni]|uniref:FecR family protein n=1 Tax=Chitinophaga caeni TaxID=2029983 RepID=A0A291QUL3_9BACT|nr:FecR family protein [Chitinophaga caeni]ATL47719.1 hypothetical protein COR50_11380 [Chitinophaga caeni]